MYTLKKMSIKYFERVDRQIKRDMTEIRYQNLFFVSQIVENLNDTINIKKRILRSAYSISLYKRGIKKQILDLQKKFKFYETKA